MRHPLDGSYPIASGFYDDRSWGQHAAQDCACPRGTPVYLAQSGIVKSAGWGGNAGNLVEVEIAGAQTRYAHLQSIGVSVGQTLVEGTLIGYSGNTTNIPGGVGPHLHWAVWFKDKAKALAVQADPYETSGYWAVDPAKWLAQEDEDMPHTHPELEATDAAIKEVLAAIADVNRKQDDTDKAIKEVLAVFNAKLADHKHDVTGKTT